jgi:hypothetical protein
VFVKRREAGVIRRQCGVNLGKASQSKTQQRVWLEKETQAGGADEVLL